MKTTRTRVFGFTLIEVLVSTGLVVVLTAMLIGVMDQTDKLWSRTRAHVDQFRDARRAFDEMTTRLSQATLNTYWDYDRPDFPTRYLRRSELRFASGRAEDLMKDAGTQHRLTHCVFFHVPSGFSATEGRSTGATDRSAQGYEGMENLINTWGYYVEYGNDLALRPGFIKEEAVPAKWRFRLMEFMLPSENLATYNLTSGAKLKPTAQNPYNLDMPFANTYKGTDWFRGPLDAAVARTDDAAAIHVLAENIVALIITPRLPKREELQFEPTGSDRSPLAPNYAYDTSPIDYASSAAISDSGGDDPSRRLLNPANQLPPVVQVTMVAIDENSAIQLGLGSSSADVFKNQAQQRFKDTTHFTKDLRIDPAIPSGEGTSLEDELIKQRVQYRIFTSNVPIRTAKWSRDQTLH